MWELFKWCGLYIKSKHTVYKPSLPNKRHLSFCIAKMQVLRLYCVVILAMLNMVSALPTAKSWLQNVPASKPAHIAPEHPRVRSSDIKLSKIRRIRKLPLGVEGKKWPWGGALVFISNQSSRYSIHTPPKTQRLCLICCMNACKKDTLKWSF